LLGEAILAISFLLSIFAAIQSRSSSNNNNNNNKQKQKQTTKKLLVEKL